MGPLGVLTRPRTVLGGAAARPSLRTAVVVVVASGIGCLAAELAAAQLAGGGGPAVVLSLAAPVLLLFFWLASGILVGAGARLMGWDPRRRELLAVTGLTFPVLVPYALIGLVQAASTHAGGDALSVTAGLLALPVIGWFVVLNALAVAAVYESSPLAAAAVALIPFAALSAVLLLLILFLSILHAAGVV